MSRELDPEIKQALKQGDHNAIFQDISTALTQQFSNPLDIEILGQSHPLEPNINYLQDKNAIAIPKLRLVQAFIVAHKLFAKHIQTTSSSERSVSSTEQIMAITSVILLMDPEHLTAANARKQALQETILLTNKESASQDSSRNHILQELYFTNSLLTSRLHRHTKSPTLWNHRKWLVSQLNHHRHHLSAARLPLDLSSEFETVIFISAERHPKNYYAWCHARYLVASLLKLAEDENSQKTVDLILITRDWCFSHHDDISGWSFLNFLLERSPDHAHSVLAETLKLVRSFSWRNEAVWWFLRSIASKGLACQEICKTIHSLQQHKSQDKILEQATQWIQLYSAR